MANLAMSMPAPGSAAAYDVRTYRKALLTAVLGNVVEWYDNALYGILAVYMAHAFFPGTNPTTALLATYAGLIVAYAIRPVGGVVMGRLSDLRGHKTVLMLTINLMTFGTVAIGLLPSYQSIGVGAPVLLILCRLIQGVGASGEYTVAANYMLEHGPPDRRQYLAGWSVGSTSLGPLLASVVALGLSAWFGREGFEAGGWRIPFLLAAPLGLTTLWIRRTIRDLPRIERALAEADGDSVDAVPFTEAVRRHWRTMTQVILLSAGQRVGTFCIQTYFVTALITQGFGDARALFASILCYIVGPPAAILGGLLADRHGGRAVLVTGFTLFSMLTIPAFAYLGTSLGATLTAVIGFTIVNNLVGAPLTHAYVLAFPPEVRGTAAALNYNVGTTLIGSTAPLIATWLYASTGTNASFSWYMTAICIMSLGIALIGYPKSLQHQPRLSL